MKEKNIEILDESNDHSYFAQIPNIIADSGNAISQAVYLQIKRFAGEHGKFFVSERNLIKRLGIGKVVYKKAINFLIQQQFITCVGEEKKPTKGGLQKRKTYIINDIWRRNIDHCQSGRKSFISDEFNTGCVQIDSPRCVQIDSPSNLSILKEDLLLNNINKANVSCETLETPFSLQEKSISNLNLISPKANDTPTPHRSAVPPSQNAGVDQRRSDIQELYELGVANGFAKSKVVKGKDWERIALRNLLDSDGHTVEQLKNALEYSVKIRHVEMAPLITSWQDMRLKYLKLQSYRDREIEKKRIKDRG